MEVGIPRGNDTTTGSYSGLLAATLTLMDALLGFEVDDDDVSILRFSPTLALCTESSSLPEDDDDELDELLILTLYNIVENLQINQW